MQIRKPIDRATRNMLLYAVTDAATGYCMQY